MAVAMAVAVFQMANVAKVAMVAVRVARTTVARMAVHMSVHPSVQCGMTRWRLPNVAPAKTAQSAHRVQNVMHALPVRPVQKVNFAPVKIEGIALPVRKASRKTAVRAAIQPVAHRAQTIVMQNSAASAPASLHRASTVMIRQRQSPCRQMASQCASPATNAANVQPALRLLTVRSVRAATRVAVLVSALRASARQRAMAACVAVPVAAHVRADHLIG